MARFSIVWGKHSFVATFEGELYLMDVLAANDRWSSDSRFDLIDAYIVDLSAVTEIHYRERDYSVNAAYSTAVSRWGKKQNVKVAIVASTEEHLEKVKKYVSVIGKTPSGWERRAFLGLEAAKAWTGIP